MIDRFRILLEVAAALAITIAAAGPSASAAPAPSKQFSVEAPAEDNSVDAELASFKLRDGFDVNLFASEELGISNPLSIRWDARGRLWVLCTWAYPQIKPGETPNDKILILEDTDNDGAADTSTVFADGLNMPMGLELGHGGAYVGHGTELLHLADTDGDDRADKRRVLLRGFGTGDTHQNINSFVWGPGGELMFGQGLHCLSRVETPWGIERLDKAGVWRFWPRQLRLDPFLHDAMGPTNPWGTVFDDWGQPFIVSGAGRGVYYLLHAMIRTDHFERFHPIALKNKLCGVDILGSLHLPDDVQDLMAVGHFWTNQVDLFELRDDASGFDAVELAPLIASTHKSFRPVDVRAGPDGAIYVADWFNPIVGHYQASFRHPDRDKAHGRIWRITATGRPLVEKPNLSGRSLTHLFEALRSPERWTRYQAKRVLAGRPTPPVIAALSAWLEKLDRKDPQYEHLLVEALGVYQSHHRLDLALLDKLSKAKDPRARAYLARALGTHGHALLGPTSLSFLGRSVRDPHPRVRLESIVALSYLPYGVSIEVAVRALDQPVDPFIDYALTQTVHALRPHWKPMLDRGWLLFEGRVDHMAYVFEADGSDDLVAHVRGLLEAGHLQPPAHAAMMKVLANIGAEDDLRFAFDRSGESATLLNELAAVHDRRRLKPNGELTADVRKLLASEDAAVRAAAARLAGRWLLRPLAPDIRRVAADTDANDKVRAEAIDTLARLLGNNAADPIDEFLAASTGLPVRSTALRALARLDLPRAARRAAEFLSKSETDAELEAVLIPVVSRQDGSEALASALATNLNVNPTAAARASRFLSARGRLDRVLQKQLNAIAGIESEILAYDETYVRALAAEAAKTGNIANGKTIYNSPRLTCVACHKISDVGGILGPDLSGIGRGLSTEVIVESVLWPKRQIKEGFLSTTITTKDGRVLTGYLQKEDRDIIAIRDVATNEEVSLPPGQVKNRTDAGSIMPEALTAGLTRKELRDLIAYLASLGMEGDAEPVPSGVKGSSP